MRFTAFALLASTTQAATALTAATYCIDAGVDAKFKIIKDKVTAKTEVTAADLKALVVAALACKTSLVKTAADQLSIGLKIEEGMWTSYAGVKVGAIKPAVTAADQLLFMTAMDAYGAALGMGMMSCAAQTKPCAARPTALLKGTY
jgi:hypothetical protein